MTEAHHPEELLVFPVTRVMESDERSTVDLEETPKVFLELALHLRGPCDKNVTVDERDRFPLLQSDDVLGSDHHGDLEEVP